MIGLGKMGANTPHRLLRGGHGVVGFNLNYTSVRELQSDSAGMAMFLSGPIEAPDPWTSTVRVWATR